MAGNTINVQGNYIDIHDNEVVNLNIDKASVSVQDNASEEAQDSVTSDSRNDIVDKLFDLIDNGDWVNGITAEDIKQMMRNVLGMGETALPDKQKIMSMKLWKMLEHGRGGDRVRLTWQNIVGYFMGKGLLCAKSAPELNKDFFGDKEGANNINKGRNGRLSEIEPLLDEYLAKIKKKK